LNLNLDFQDRMITTDSLLRGHRYHSNFVWRQGRLQEAGALPEATGDEVLRARMFRRQEHIVPGAELD
jgi:hypothetical protein